MLSPFQPAVDLGLGVFLGDIHRVFLLYLKHALV